MLEVISKESSLIESTTEAISNTSVTPQIIPIRGGTDGARLSFMGLPCPNIFTGGLNFHSKSECIPVNSMEKCSRLIVKIAEKYAQR